MLVALTGGIAAGKSTVAAELASCGAVVVDADQLAREAVAPGSPGLAAVVAEFGRDLLTPAGEMDRSALGAVVFGDDSARLRLEAIIHPRVHRLSHERFSAAREADPDVIIVYDVPLLVEAKRTEEFDAVIVVEAPDEVRINRLVSLRGMTRGEAVARVAAQATNAERRALADYLIDTSRSLEDTRRATREVWNLLSGGTGRRQ